MNNDNRDNKNGKTNRDNRASNNSNNNNLTFIMRLGNAEANSKAQVTALRQNA